MKVTIRETLISITAAAFLAVSGTALAGAQHDKQPVKDAWIDGKLEAAYTLNSHLNPFAIHTEVRDGVVILTGTVESDIDRDLAKEIAVSIDGVTDVDNRLEVAPGKARTSEKDAAERDFAQVVSDATTTAKIKAKLAANDNVKARDINVDTRMNMVTLTGEVDSEQARELAELIARNTSDVQSVDNQLTVNRPVASADG